MGETFGNDPTNNEKIINDIQRALGDLRIDGRDDLATILRTRMSNEYGYTDAELDALEAGDTGDKIHPDIVATFDDQAPRVDLTKNLDFQVAITELKNL